MLSIEHRAYIVHLSCKVGNGRQRGGGRESLRARSTNRRHRVWIHLVLDWYYYEEPSNREAQPVTSLHYWLAVTWSRHGAAGVMEGETMGRDAGPNMVAFLCACAGKEWEGRDEGWGTSRAHHGGPQKSRLRISA